MFKTIAIILILGGLCFQQVNDPIDQLLGIWETDIGIFEEWSEDDFYKGSSYSYKNDEKTILEELKIIKRNDSVIYCAKPLNQHKDFIEFPMTFSSMDSLIFENSDHDFPTYIKYIFIDEKHMKAVVGNDQTSFRINYVKAD